MGPAPNNVTSTNIQFLQTYYKTDGVKDEKTKKLIDHFMQSIHVPKSLSPSPIDFNEGAPAVKNSNECNVTSLFQTINQFEEVNIPCTKEQQIELAEIYKKIYAHRDENYAIATSIADFQEALVIYESNVKDGSNHSAASSVPPPSLDDFIPSDCSPIVANKMRIIGKAIERKDLAIPFRSHSLECLEPLLNQRISKSFLGINKDGIISLKEELENCGALSKRKKNHRCFNGDKLEKYLTELSKTDSDKSRRLRYVFNEFQFDTHSEESEMRAWETHSQEGEMRAWEEGNLPNNGLIGRAVATLHADPAVGRTQWWAESGAVASAFQTRYGLGGGICKLPYAILRDILFAVKDAMKMLFISPERMEAFKRYLDNPTAHNLSEMFKSGVTAALFVTILDAAIRLIVFNRSSLEAIREFLNDSSKENFMKLAIKWPGAIAGAFLAATWVLVETGKFLLYNPDSKKQYQELLKDQSLSNVKELIMSNPGILAGAFATAGVLLESLIFNPSHIKKTLEHLKPANSDDDNLENTFTVFTENPGILFAVGAIIAKYIGFNPSSKKHYDNFVEKPTKENLGKLWHSNPGLIGGAFMTLFYGLDRLVVGTKEILKAIIWNPSARKDVGEHLMPATSDEDNMANAFTVFTKNPGFLFAVGALIIKYLGVNYAVTQKYTQLLGNLSRQQVPQLDSQGNAMSDGRGDMVFREETTREVVGRNWEDFKALWKSNPGLIGGAFMTLIYGLDLVLFVGVKEILKAVIWNPGAMNEAMEHLNPEPHSDEDNMWNALTVFGTNPGILFAVGALITKYVAFNYTHGATYGNFIEELLPIENENTVAYLKRNGENFSKLWKANPGLIGGAFMTLAYTFHLALTGITEITKAVVWNPGAMNEAMEHLNPTPHSDEDNMWNALTVFGTNPGILFAVGALITKYVAFNYTHGATYGNFIEGLLPIENENTVAYLKRNGENFSKLWKANPGLIGGAFMTLAYTFHLAFTGITEITKAVVWNPGAMNEAMEHLNPTPHSDEDNMWNALTVFGTNPGILFAVGALITKYVAFNYTHGATYGNFIEGLLPIENENTVAYLKRNGENFSKLWKANPGLIGGAFMTLAYTFHLALTGITEITKAVVWNPEAMNEAMEHLNPTPHSDEDNMWNALTVFGTNPGILFAVGALITKYVAFNYTHGATYGNFIEGLLPIENENTVAYLKRNGENFSKLWKANPGLIGGAFMTLAYTFHLALTGITEITKAVVWNPEAMNEAMEHLNPTPHSDEDNMWNALTVFGTNPGILFAVGALITKYVAFNYTHGATYGNFIEGLLPIENENTVAYLKRNGENFSKLWKANPGLIGGAFMTLAYTFHLALTGITEITKAVVWNPGAMNEAMEHLNPTPHSDEDNMWNALTVFGTNPGILFAVGALITKYVAFNYTHGATYGNFIEGLLPIENENTVAYLKRNGENFSKLWKANPGLIGGAFMTLAYTFHLALTGITEITKAVVWNPGAMNEAMEHLNPTPHSDEDNMWNALTVFGTNPGILFAVGALITKYVAFNYTHGATYGNFIEGLLPIENENTVAYLKRNGENFSKLWKANPGLIGGAFMTLAYTFHLALTGITEITKAVVWNPGAMNEAMEHLNPTPHSDEDNMWNALTVFGTNPGILFAVGALITKYVAFNYTHGATYGNFIEGLLPIENENTVAYLKRNGENFSKLWKANPGLIGGAFMTLAYTFHLALTGITEITKAVVWNPEAMNEAMEHLNPEPHSDEDNMWNALTVFGTNPGILFAVGALITKYVAFNYTHGATYGNFIEELLPIENENTGAYLKRNGENFARLWKANPGLIGGAFMTLAYTFHLAFTGITEITKAVIWNPSAMKDVGKHLMPGSSDEDHMVNALAVFKENPGFLFAVGALITKYFVFNYAAVKEYDTFIHDRNLENFTALWKSNPGLIAGTLAAIELVFEFGIKALLFNPDFAAKDFMFDKDASMKDIGLSEAGERTFQKWPGLVYCVALLSVKYGLMNFSASEQYLTALTSLNRTKDIGALFKASPGVAGITIFLCLKLFGELGVKIFYDPRLKEAYDKFWENPTLENSLEIAQAGLVGAALTAIGRGLSHGFRGMRGIADALDNRVFED